MAESFSECGEKIFCDGFIQWRSFMRMMLRRVMGNPFKPGEQVVPVGERASSKTLVYSIPLGGPVVSSLGIRVT
eukprot:8682713-Heterocapsa_arctica.AAC.1